MKNDLLTIHALADGEVDRSERAALEASVASCPESSREYLAIQELKTVVQKHAAPVPADEVWKACAKRIESIDRALTVERFVGKYAWALCGAFVIAIFVGGIRARMHGGNQVQASDVAGMIGVLSPFSSSVTEPRSTGDLFPGSGQVPVNNNVGSLESVAHRQGNYGGRRVACVTLQDRLGRVALIAVADASGVADATRAQGPDDVYVGRCQDLNCVSWSAGQYTLLLLGDRPVADLERIAAKIRVR